MSKVGKDCTYNRKAIPNAKKNGKKKKSMETVEATKCFLSLTIFPAHTSAPQT